MIILELNILSQIQQAFEDFTSTRIDGVPVFIIAIVLFISGYLIAKVVSVILEKTLKKIKFDDLAVKLKLDEPLRIIGIKVGLSHLVSKIVFWLIMIVVIQTTTDNLGIAVLQQQVKKILNFIPSLITAVLILLIGYFIATKIKEVLVNLTKSLGGNAGAVLGNILYYFIMLMVVITAMDQMGIQTDLISKNILIIVSAVLVAGGLAYSYAASEIMRNMLSSFYSKKNFYVGLHIKIGDLEGRIVDIDNTSVTLQTTTSKVISPSSELLSNYVEILNED
ncbi:mechanosensitive ion channel [Bacteroidia bacterium]|nr:mechanosensitive ion channel [Bacteroidia bacterium]MDC1394935.1 mechanosensitive ion channel [Bacteroidia bacterium]